MNAKNHLSIGEVLNLLQAEFPDVTISKIRFLESQGLIDPERTPSGYRKFYDADIDRLRWILAQQRDHFLPLKVIKDRLDEADASQVPLVPPAVVPAGSASGASVVGTAADGEPTSVVAASVVAASDSAPTGRTGSTAPATEVTTRAPAFNVFAGSAHARPPVAAGRLAAEPPADPAGAALDAVAADRTSPAHAGGTDTVGGAATSASDDRPAGVAGDATGGDGGVGRAAGGGDPGPEGDAPPATTNGGAMSEHGPNGGDGDPPGATAATTTPASGAAAGPADAAAGPGDATADEGAAPSANPVRAGGGGAAPSSGRSRAGGAGGPGTGGDAAGAERRGRRRERARAAFPDVSSVSFTVEELAAAVGSSVADVEELERFGLLSSRPVNGGRRYGEEAVLVARLAARFAAFGIEARHLRMFRVAVDRELALYEQVVLPIGRARGDGGEVRAAEVWAELDELGADLRDALFHRGPS